MIFYVGNGEKMKKVKKNAVIQLLVNKHHQYSKIPR